VADVDHPWNDPHVLLRYMYAPHGYKHAERLFRNMIQWRLDHNVDTILETYTPPPALLRYASPLAFLRGLDRDGDPIYVERGGAMDGQGLLKRFSQQQLMRHAIWLRELQSSGAWVAEYERTQHKCIKDITVIFDLQGLSSSHCNPGVLNWFQSHMKMTEDYYPGPIKRIIVVRAPTIFRIIWSIVQHFFPQTARDKMIFPSNNNYLQVLEKYMDTQKVLPDLLCPGGEGSLALGMEALSLEAGKIPFSVGKNGSGCQYRPPKATVIETVSSVPQQPQSAAEMEEGRQESMDRTSSHNSSNGTRSIDGQNMINPTTLPARKQRLRVSRQWPPQRTFEEVLTQTPCTVWHEPNGAVETTHKTTTTN